MSDEIKLHISGMIYNQSMGGTYSLVLTEDEGQKRRFSVLIGESEAQSIALKLNNTTPPRPLSHDLMNSIIRELNSKVVKVLIYEMKNEIFHSEIYLVHDSKPIIIDARTSDAIALAVRSNAPIYITAEILNKVGTVIDVEEMVESMQQRKEVEKLTPLSELTVETISIYKTEQLEEFLNRAIEEENYEIAALIRDEIELRENNF